MAFRLNRPGESGNVFVDTVANVRKGLLQSLRSFGIDQHEARREADLIIEYASGLSISQQMLRGEEILGRECLEKIARIQQQRQLRMPLQYCLGESWFMGLRFRVTPDVLIPRADTEILVERALELGLAPGLGAGESPAPPGRTRTSTELAKIQVEGEMPSSPKPGSAGGSPAPTSPKTQEFSILDVGTGSGAIVIAMLIARPDAIAVGLDISAPALAVASINAETHRVQDRVEFVCQDWEQFDSAIQFDCIVSNPPYIPRSLETELQPEVSVFEPKQALFGSDSDGLGFYRSLSISASRHLKPGGFIAMEVGQGQAPAVEDIFRNQGWLDVCSRPDLNGISRVVSAFRAGLTIENSD